MRLWYPFTQIGQTLSGTVATFSLLPSAATYTGMFYRVTTASGVIFVNRHEAGVYVSDGSTWIYVADLTEHDQASEIQNDSSVTGSTVKDALDNLGLATAHVYTAQQNFGAVAITSSGASVAWNLNTAQYAKHTITEATTVSAPTNMVDGGTYTLRVTQHASSPNTMAWNAVFKWPGGVVPVLTATNSAVDVFNFTSDGTSMFGVYQQGFA